MYCLMVLRSLKVAGEGYILRGMHVDLTKNMQKNVHSKKVLYQVTTCTKGRNKKQNYYCSLLVGTMGRRIK